MRIHRSARCLVMTALVVLQLGMADGVVSAQDQKAMVDTLARFDQLDFDAFSKENWTLFNQIHCDDVKVVFPDGRETRGIKQHQADIAGMFVATPDMRVSAHPVSFSASEWASTTPDSRAAAAGLRPGRWSVAVGTLEATFTKPWPMNGKVVQPTGNKLKLPMVTLARWEKGCIAEELLFWDNAAYMQQLGVK